MSGHGIVRRAVPAVVAVVILAPGALARGAEIPERTLREVAEKVVPSVVALYVERTAEVPAGLPDELQRFFGQRFALEPPPGLEAFLRYHFRQGSGTSGLGSGIILDEEGLVVTNAHVVGGAAAVTAELSTGKRVAAEVLGVDTRSDIAVVRLGGRGPFRPIEKAPADGLRTGDRVLAVGSPMGFAGTVSAGIVSHPARYLPPEIDYLIRGARARGVYYGRLIQTDALINRGSSGGALVDMKGRLVGMAVILYRSGAARPLPQFSVLIEMLRGPGFAIPAGKLDRIVPVLAEGREIEYGYLGISPETLLPELAEALGLGERRGVAVNFVEEGSPASKAGLAPGEVIVAMDGVPLLHEGDLIEGVGAEGPGAEVEFQIASPGGEVRTVKAKLVRRRRSGPREGPEPPAEEKEGAGGLWRGVEFEDHRGEVRIARVKSGSPAARAGLRPRMRVNEIVVAGKRVRPESAEELMKALAGAPGPVAFRTDKAGYVAVPAE